MSLLGGTLLFRNFKVIIPVKPREEVVRERKVTCLAATHVRRGAHFACILLKKERPKHSRLLFLCKRSNLWSIFQKIKNDNKNNTAIGTILIMVVVIQNDARFSSNMHGFFKSPPLVYLTNFKGNSVDRWIGCYHCCVECHSRAFEISHTKTAEAIIIPSTKSSNVRPIQFSSTSLTLYDMWIIIRLFINKGKLAMYWIYFDYFKDCRFVNMIHSTSNNNRHCQKFNARTKYVAYKQIR